MAKSLSQSEAAQLHALALQSDLADPHRRSLLLAWLPSTTIAQIPIHTTPAEQLYSDLYALNTLTLPDGSPALAVWLDNAARLVEYLPGLAARLHTFRDRLRAATDTSTSSAEQPRVKSPLTWLHLSDLHFGYGSHNDQRYQTLVLDELCRDARRLREKIGAPDLVFITGDIAYSAGPAQYSDAAKWLSHLAEMLGVDKSAFLVVPGNHDVEWASARGSFSRRATHEWLRLNPRLLDEILAEPDMKLVWEKFQPYAEFASVFGAPHVSAVMPFWRHELTLKAGAATVLGLNTALLSYANGDSPDNLALGGTQLCEVATSNQEHLVIVLAHHPPSWIVDGADLTALLTRRASILITGHANDTGGRLGRDFVLGSHLHITAGATHGPTSEPKPRAYSWGRLSPEGYRHWPRVWGRPPRFVVDTSFDGLSDESVLIPIHQLPAPLSQWLEG